MPTWDKLSIINEALTNSVNNPVVTADDGSDEWRVASSAYEQWVPILLYRRSWKFATRLVQLQEAFSANTANDFSNDMNADFAGSGLLPNVLIGYSDVYAKPADCLFFMNCWRADYAALLQPLYGLWSAPSSQDDRRPPSLDYRVVGDQIHTVAPQGVVALYVPFPVGAQPWSVGFVAALRLRIEAACFRGLNEDFVEARRAEKDSETALAEAGSRADAEEPRRVLFRSTVMERRRRRFYGCSGT